MDEAALPAVDALYDAAPCGLLLARGSGQVLRVNATLCRWLGYGKEELEGAMRLPDLLTMGGRIFHQTHLAPLLRMQGSVAEVKLELRHKAGHAVPMMVNVAQHHKYGADLLEAAFFVAEDRHKYERELLLQRQRAEQLAEQHAQAQRELALAQTRLRLALESANLFVWDVEPATRQPRYEDSVARLLGAPGPQRVDAARFGEALHPEDRQRQAEAFEQATRAGCGVYRCVYRLLGEDRQERVVASSGVAFFDDAGALAQFAGVLQDVTAEARHNAEVQDRALFAEQMVGIVSHDLRNPLAAIHMSAMLLERGELSTQQRTVLARIANSTGRAQRLINDLLDFTQARLGRGLQLRRAPLELHALVADGVAELALSFPERRIRHVQRGDGRCSADADRLAQLLGNLVGNAVAYGEPSEPITVTSEGRGGRCAISVHNHGQPIPPELMQDLFEPMIRGTHKTLGGRGVGLGLYIVREIVRAHGGTVEVASNAAEGTTFTAWFPAQAEVS